MNELGKMLILIGGVAVVAGLILMLVGKTPLGRLPGDIVIRRDNFTLAFPLATSILISAVLSVIFWMIYRFRQ
ncbi:MAG: DUF2905 domain-containing protein [Phycisphaerae bacterium]|jgi:hypothetical protein|nr:DUF2905 domain-containing protein [Phycisphaerae bacterium]